MCGIGGIFSLHSFLDAKDERIHKIGEAIYHRGPDDVGYYQSKKAHFVHRRLSIIDLSGGHQPIYNEDGTIAVVYNGEIYNYQELRVELIAKGHKFKTQSDTEILVHGYEEEGIGFIHRLNGMFAFALWDDQIQKGFVVRDRFGVKPLFYHANQNELIFSSELNGVKCVLGNTTNIDHQALSNYLTFSFITEPRSIFSEISRLCAGHYLEIENGVIRDCQYYDLDFSKKIVITAAEAEKEVARLFNQSVQRQMMSDVPVGVMLSGGLDSRSILASSSAQGYDLASFTITYQEKDFDESDAADFWATFFNSKHYKLMYDEDWFIEQIASRQQHIGEPYGFFCDTAYFALAEYCREQGVKVILSGAGGDELFAGYPTLNAAYVMQYYNKLPQIMRGSMAKIANLLPAGKGYLPITFLIKSFVNASDENTLRSFMKFKQIFTEEEKYQILSGDRRINWKDYDPFLVYQQYFQNIENFHFIDQLSYFDFKVFLSGNLFFSGDNEFMAAGVEQRVPFIDNDLIDFTLTLPVDVRFNLFKLKSVLKNALNEHVMADYQVPKTKYRKRGFEIPIDHWMKQGKFKDFLLRELATSKYFNSPFVQGKLKGHFNGKSNNDRVLQNLYSLHLFLRNNETSISFH
jgi:asparagine synthase (glutamine-hydrolysing)